MIIWPGSYKGETYPAQIRETIMERVSNGTSLILLYQISDDKHSDLWDILTLTNTKAGDAQS